MGLSRAAPVTAPIRCRLVSIPLPLPLPAARHWLELATEKRHILTLSLPNGSERLCCITLMNSHHHHRYWLHHSAHVLVDRSSHELDES